MVFAYYIEPRILIYCTGTLHHKYIDKVKSAQSKLSQFVSTGPWAWGQLSA